MGKKMNANSAAANGSSLRLFQLALGVLVFHLLNSVLQEAVFRLPGFNHTVLLSFLQALCIALIALAEFRRGGLTRRAPLRTYFYLSLLSAGSVMLTNQASHLLNYPTQVIFKSSKLLFVMTLRFFLIKKRTHHHNHHHHHKQQTVSGAGASSKDSSSSHRPSPASQMSSLLSNHKFQEVVASLMIVGGLICFTYATAASKLKEHHHNDHRPSSGTATSNFPREDDDSHVLLFGVLAIITALVFDALLYIGEEKYCFSAHDASNTEVILYCYAFASANSAATLVVSGNGVESFTYLFTHPQFAFFVVLFSAANFCGTHFLLMIVSEYNSNSAVMVTSVRKMFTVVLSFLIYPNHFQFSHLQGLVLVSVGIYIHETTRSRGKKEEALLAAEVIDGGENVV